MGKLEVFIWRYKFFGVPINLRCKVFYEDQWFEEFVCQKPMIVSGQATQGNVHWTTHSLLARRKCKSRWGHSCGLQKCWAWRLSWRIPRSTSRSARLRIEKVHVLFQRWCPVSKSCASPYARIYLMTQEITKQYRIVVDLDNFCTKKCLQSLALCFIALMIFFTMHTKNKLRFVLFISCKTYDL